MKLRIKGNSLRLRLSKSDVQALVEGGQIEETVYFTPSPGAFFTYALNRQQDVESLAVEYQSQRVTISVATNLVQQWANSEDVGIYGSTESSHGPLDLIIEKDFACLDASDAENEDAFPNPNAECAPQS